MMPLSATLFAVVSPEAFTITTREVDTPSNAYKPRDVDTLAVGVKGGVFPMTSWAWPR